MGRCSCHKQYALPVLELLTIPSLAVNDTLTTAYVLTASDYSQIAYRMDAKDAVARDVQDDARITCRLCVPAVAGCLSDCTAVER